MSSCQTRECTSLPHVQLALHCTCTLARTLEAFTPGCGTVPFQGHRPFQNTTMVDEQKQTITLSDNLPSSVASGNMSTAHVDNGIVRAAASTCVDHTNALSQRAHSHACNLARTHEPQQFETGEPALWRVATCRRLVSQQAVSQPTLFVTQVYSTYRYTFDRVYGPDATQQEVYDNSARDSVKQVLEVGVLPSRVHKSVQEEPHGRVTPRLGLQGHHDRS